MAGNRIPTALEWVSAAGVRPDVFTDMVDAVVHRAAVDIPAGTPITPDLLEPPAE